MSAQIEIPVVVEDEAVERLQKKIASLEARLEKAGRSGRRMGDDLDRGAKKGEGSMRMLRGGLRQVAAAVGVTFGIAGIKRFFDYIESRSKRLADQAVDAGTAAAAAVSGAGYGAHARLGGMARDMITSVHGSGIAGGLSRQQISASFAAAAGDLQYAPGDEGRSSMNIANINRLLQAALPATHAMGDSQREGVLAAGSKALALRPGMSDSELASTLSKIIGVSAFGGAELPRMMELSGAGFFEGLNTLGALEVARGASGARATGVEAILGAIDRDTDDLGRRVPTDLTAAVRGVLANPGAFGITGRQATEVGLISRGFEEARTGLARSVPLESLVAGAAAVAGPEGLLGSARQSVVAAERPAEMAAMARETMKADSEARRLGAGENPMLTGLRAGVETVGMTDLTQADAFRALVPSLEELTRALNENSRLKNAGNAGIPIPQAGTF